MKRRGKFNAVKTTVDGFRFDSRGEAARWVVLRDREQAGLISALERQPTYRLTVNGEKIADYRADFRYVRSDTGETVVEDAKSVATSKLPVFRLKQKLMRACHGIDVYVTLKPDAI